MFSSRLRPADLSAPTHPATRRLHPPVFRRRRSTEAAIRLLGLLEQLGAGAQFERSFKVLRGQLEAHRFLLAVDKRAIRDDANVAVHRLCEALGMPEAGLRLFRDHVAEADVVGFGLDEDDTTCLVKGYLEFRRRYAEAKRAPREPSYAYVSHVGVKWDAADPARHVLAEYRCFPALTVDDVRARLQARDSAAVTVVRELVELASRRTGPDGLLYLEVAEAETPRASFDINLYPADLRVSEVREAMVALARHFAVPEPRFLQLYQTMQDATLGHVAGGMDRRGREFVTVYFEE